MVSKTHIREAISSIQIEMNTMLENEISHFIDNIPENVRPILTYYHEQGGKRLRPALFVLLSQSLGSKENFGPYALAIELIHTMSLYHDDFIDGAEERRGALTAHKNWDVATAIIGGDILHSKIHHHIIHSAKNDRISMEYAIEFINELTKAEVLIGCAALEEMRLSTSRQFPDLEVIEEVNSGKTAPLFAFSAKMAGVISDRTNTVDILYDLGWKIGEAFQLLDDLLDFFPSNKDIGGDLREARKTPLLYHAYQEDPEYIAELLSKASITEKDVIAYRTRFTHIFLDMAEQIKETIQTTRRALFEIIEANETIKLLFEVLLDRSDVIINSLTSKKP